MREATTRDRALGRLAARAAHKALRRRDPFAELIAQTRRRIEHELAQVDAELHAAKIKRDAAQLRYQHLEASAQPRKDDLQRRLAAL